MSSDCSIPQSETSSPSSSTILEATTSYSSSTDRPSNAQPSSRSLCDNGTPAFPDNHGYLSASYEAKGKRRASEEDISVSHSDDIRHLSEGLDDISIDSATSSPSQLHSSTSGLGSRGATPEDSASVKPPDRERRFRKGRESVSRSVAPSPLRSALNASPTTGSASQFVLLLGQPASVSASLSAPNKSSTATTSAALPSLYKASRGRSANVSPSRRWDRRGASATVLSGASASGSGGEGDEPSDEDTTSRPVGQQHRTDEREIRPSSRSSNRRLSVPREEALFPSDDDDDDESPPFSPTEEVRSGPLDQIEKHRRRSRRWSSTERDRRRGMRILLQERKNEILDSVETLRVSRSKASGRGRTRSTTRANSANEDDCSDLETSSLPSSCTSSCDLNYVPSRSRAETVAIPIKEARSRRSSPRGGAQDASVSVASSLGQVPSSTDGSDDRSPAASTPSTSLIQRSPPGFTALKPIVAIPVLSDSDPLLGLSTPSVEDMIQVDQVEFFPEEAISAQLASAKVKRKTSPKRSKKSSWIIGDFESEPESDEDPKPAKRSLDSAVDRRNVTAISSSPPSSSPSSYQARLASLQSQLRIWSRTQDAPVQSRVRQISSGSEDQADAEADAKEGESNGASLLSASWRNLTRLPNLILLPGLAARQARESLASASKAQTNGSDGSNSDAAAPLSSNDDFAQIYRLASASQGLPDEKTLQAQRDVALKTGRPPSPSPSPSPPTSLLGSRQSSNDSISTTDRSIQTYGLPGNSRRGRGVASPLEADRDPSAYVSGLGQPIDPDTELSSVVQLQTFRSRSRSRPADVGQRGRSDQQPRSASPRHSADRDGHELRQGRLSPKKLGQPVELEPTHEETAQGPSGIPAKAAAWSSACTARAPELLAVQIPTPDINGSLARSRLGRHDVFGEGPKPTDTASAPTSPTYRKQALSSSATTSGDETDSVPSPPSQGGMEGDASLDVDGFRVVRRRNRRRSSGPKSLRPKVDALVPQGYSAFAIDESEEAAEGAESDGETTPSPTPARRSRARRGRASSPHRSTRQCAVGLFGGGMPQTHSSSSSKEFSPSSSRSRRSGNREGSHISISTPIRSVRSSPDLTYAAAAAVNAALGGDQEGEAQTKGEPSPPRGSRGRRGAVKVVASSVGQRAPPPQPLLLSGMEGLRRGPSYPPRAGERFEDGAAAGTEAWEEDPSSSTSGGAARGGRGRSASSPTCGNASPQPLRFRLLSNSSHLLMLSLELDMIKKQKISAPLKPRWGKHRANDFNPLPSTISSASSAALYATSKYLRSPFTASRDDKEVDGSDDNETEAGECHNARCSPCDQVGSQVELVAPSLTIGTAAAAVAVHRPAGSSMASGLRNPRSRLRYSWSVADIASVLDTAASV
ncbi:hypothetical protein PHSY_007198 [Pseudozyma hubeiensis SY62]|uniref:Uncharacterized protein n=1 Tax=Pseudozyma hubeiensis (strain SY62) TaxID=1305764 RepID=R9PN81_PSEHS|nr:hypothetical protein PHSY_007198 [Pseudozyma hubeiensis SY62]GAC99595.1 hypothetical protein PHSY_007198 [Pseudozyma hubeiensis SY62]